MSKKQYVVIGIILIGWIVLSVKSLVYSVEQQTVSTYCGIIIGKYESRGRSSSYLYVIIRFDDNHVWEMVDSYLHTMKSTGDRICARWRKIDVYGMWGWDLGAIFVNIINAVVILYGIGWLTLKGFKMLN